MNDQLSQQRTQPSPAIITARILHGDTVLKITKDTMRAIVGKYLADHMPRMISGCSVEDITLGERYGSETFEIKIVPVEAAPKE